VRVFLFTGVQETKTYRVEDDPIRRIKKPEKNRLRGLRVAVPLRSSTLVIE